MESDGLKGNSYDLSKEALERAVEALEADKRRSVRGVAVEFNLCHVALARYLKKKKESKNILNGNTSDTSDSQKDECMEGYRNRKEKVRVRNKLTLEERLQAIKEYERTPVFRHVAKIMNCSFYQIKRIIRNKDLLRSATEKPTQRPKDAFENIGRSEKIDILNKVIFEWIQRSQSRKGDRIIPTKLIRTIALNVRQLIRVPNFFPDYAWLESFMAKYNITEEDLKNKGVYARCGEGKCYLPTNIPSIIKSVMQLHNESKSTAQYHNSKDPESNYGQVQEDNFYQIKRTIRSKDLYLRSSATEKSLQPPKDAFEYIGRSEKIDILNKVILEWILRSQSRKDDRIIPTKLIRTIALNVRQLIRVPNFFPDYAWLESFMTKYNITEEDLKNKGVYTRCGEEKSYLPTNIPSIIKSVMQLHNESKSTVQYHNSKDPGPNYGKVQEENFFITNDCAENNSSDSEVILIEDEGEEDSGTPPIKIKKVYGNVKDIDQLLKTDCATASVMKVENSDFKDNVSEFKEKGVFKKENYSSYIISGEPMLEAGLSFNPTCSSSLTCPQPVPIAIHCVHSHTSTVLPVQVEAIDAEVVEDGKEEINTHEEAINCVKMLEEFALLEENIRLIGLIERLEEALNAKK